MTVKTADCLIIKAHIKWLYYTVTCSVQSEVLPFYRENSHCEVDGRDTIQPCVLVAFNEAFRLWRLAAWTGGCNICYFPGYQQMDFTHLSHAPAITEPILTIHWQDTCMSNTPCYTSSDQWLWMKVQIIMTTLYTQTHIHVSHLTSSSIPYVMHTSKAHQKQTLSTAVTSTRYSSSASCTTSVWPSWAAQWSMV